MKKNLLTITFLTLSILVNAQWINQNVPFAFEGYINDIEIASPDVVWANPYDATSGTPSPSNTFVKTTDGGTTWTTGTTSGAPTASLISNIWPIDSMTCYVAMYNSTAAGGGVYKTTDGGTSWANVDPLMFAQPTSFPNFVYFNNPQNGAAMGDPAGPLTAKYELWTTSDSGNTWARTPGANIPSLANPAEYGITNLFTAIDNHIWFGTTYGDVYHSNDMGMTWTKAPSGLPPFNNTGNRQDISDIAFADTLNGIILQVNATGYLVSQTSDGGNTWVPIIPTGQMFISDIDAVPGSNLLVSAGSSNLGGFGTSYSMDYGSSWTAIDTGVSHTTIDFYDNATGYSGEYILSGGPGGAWKYSGAPLAISTFNQDFDQTYIYPNPANENVYIATSTNTQAHIEVYNVNGQRILNEITNLKGNFIYTLNVEKLKAGIYFVRVNDGFKESTHKIVIN